jgi:hypothetical protein
LDIYEKIDDLSRKKFAMHESSFHTDIFKSNTHHTTAAAGGGGGGGGGGGLSSHPRASSRSPTSRGRQRQHVPATHTHTHTRHDHDHAKKPSRRADFDGISENDLIANGLYTLTPQQLGVFHSFTEMISSFDHTDMVSEWVSG